LKKAPAGLYHTYLLDNTGKAIAAFSFNHTEGMLQQAISASAIVSNGIYELEVSMPGKKTNLLKVMVQR
jgi:hypothetical protein